MGRLRKWPRNWLRAGLEGRDRFAHERRAGAAALDVLREAGNAWECCIHCRPCRRPSEVLEALAIPGTTYAFAGDEHAAAWASELIDRLGGRALRVDAEFWQHYHAGAVMACNYQMTLVDAALELMAMAGIGPGGGA